MLVTTAFALLLVITLYGCGGGGGGSSAPAAAPPVPPVNQAFGGLWQGTDSDGDTIIALSTDSGAFHWVATTGEQGFGAASVDGSDVTFNYNLLTPSRLGLTLGDGSDSATCSGTGTIQERQTLSVNVSCTTSLGGTFNNFVPLTYNPLYDRDPSLLTVAGNDVPDAHPDPNNPGVFQGVVTIDSNGVVFEQDPDSGCIVSSQVSLVDAQYNAYAVSLTFSSCVGAYFGIDNSSGRFGPDPFVVLSLTRI